MNKEKALAHLGNLWAQTKQIDTGSKRYLEELIKQALTPPTEKEVCEALGEYFHKEVKYIEKTIPTQYIGDKCFYKLSRRKDTDHTTFFIKRGISFIDGHEEMHIQYALPPHLITMIGRFYEGRMKDERD